MPRFRITALVDIEIVAIVHPPGGVAKIDATIPEAIPLRRGETREDFALIRRVRETAGSGTLEIVPHPFQPGQLIWPGGLMQIECIE